MACEFCGGRNRSRRLHTNHSSRILGIGLADLFIKKCALRHWTWQIGAATGNVDYLHQGARQFTDKGWAVVFRSNDAESDIMLARQKFGRDIDVQGSEDFRKRTVRLAVEHRVDVRFGDAMMEAHRVNLIRLLAQREEAERLRAAQRTRPAPPPQRVVGEPPRPAPRPEPLPPSPSRDGPDR